MAMSGFNFTTIQSVPQETSCNKTYESYVFWNNKGGVGKTTLTQFNLASLYAKKNPNTRVVVIDMCPQANISQCFLGGGNQGQELQEAMIGNDNVGTVCKFLVYQNTLITTGTNPKKFSFQDFLVRPKDHNTRIPENIQLLVGSQRIVEVTSMLERTASATGLHMFQDVAWSRVHSILKDGIEEMANSIQEDLVVFIDTNPYFSLTTAMAIVAGLKLIIPVKADDYSRQGIKMLLSLVFGPSDIAASFSRMASHVGLRLPKIHLVIAKPR